MKNKLKEKAIICGDFVKSHIVEIGIGTAVVCAAILGVKVYKDNLKHEKEGERILQAFLNVPKPQHCVELPSTTLKNALETIEETFKDVDKNTEVFALIYD